MSKKSVGLALLLATVFFVAGFAFQTPRRPQWEYKTEDVLDSSFADEKLTALGSQGWELVNSRASQRNPGFVTYVFKRQK